MARRKKLGNQNPTQSVILKYIKKKSVSDEAISIYERTGLSCYTWQVNLLRPIMAVDKNGLWVHQKFGYSIPRRNGKSEILYILELWGLHNGLNILHTAHRISTSHSSFEKVKRYLEKMGYVDGEDFNSIRAKGQERIELYEGGGVVQFRTRTSNGGLGEGFDLLIIDEAQEYTTEQESALKYTVTDSDNPIEIIAQEKRMTVLEKDNEFLKEFKQSATQRLNNHEEQNKAILVLAEQVKTLSEDVKELKTLITKENLNVN